MEPILKRRARTAVPSTYGRRRANATMVRRPMSAAGRRPGVPGATGWATGEGYENLAEGGVEEGASSNRPITPPASTAARGLHSAVEKCRFHQLNFLMDSGTRLSLRNDRGESALVTALRIPADRSREKMFNFLLRRGVGCDVRDPATGRDILLWACHLGRDVQVRRLLQVCLGDLDFHKRDHTGRTCLHYAVEAGWVQIVATMARGMRRFGLSVDVPDANGVTPFIQAKRLEDGHMQEVLVREGKASPSQFDLDELHLIGSSAVSTSSSTQPPRKPRYVVPPRTRRINPSSTSVSTFSTESKVAGRLSRVTSSSVSTQGTWGITSSGRGVNDEDSSTSSNGNAWTLTAPKFKPLRKSTAHSSAIGVKGEAHGRISWSSSAWTEGTGHGPSTSTPVASHSCSFTRSSGAGSPTTQNYSGKGASSSHNTPMVLSTTIDVTRTQSTSALNINKNAISGTVSQGVAQASSSSLGATDDMNAVPEMFKFMSLQLTPAYRPKADPKLAYKAPPKPTPKAKGAWGMVGLFSRLKAKSQRIRMQTKAKGERRQSTQLDPSQLASMGKGKLVGRLKQQVAT